MDRRKFLKRTSLASGGLFFVPQFVKAFDTNLITSLSNKKVVIIHLKGGNDGLNTVVPFTNDLYFQKRQKLALLKNEYFKITDEVALHKQLQPLRGLYDKGYLSIINNVGYPNPNRSHFRSTDIWHTASDSNEFLESGWIGRYLDHTKSKAHNAIEVDQSLSLLLKGNNLNGLAVSDPKLLYKITQEPFFDNVIKHHKDSHLNEHNLGYLYDTMISAQSSAKYIYDKTKTQSSTQTYPKNIFGKQLKNIAEFINSGLETQVYYAGLGGFDTHANQKNRQSKLLQIYAESVGAFIKDIEKNNKFEDVLILTFSEFGRRVQQNGSNGTDHGCANNLFVMGKNLKKKGLYNNMPDLQNLDKNGDIKYKVDFREVYATILNNWLKVDDEKVLNKSFSKLNFI